jgi:hypothetical protein
VASYDDAEKLALIRSSRVDLSNDGIVTADDVKLERFKSTDKLQLSLFGEADYLTSQVFGGPGQCFLGERYGRFRNMGPDVGGSIHRRVSLLLLDRTITGDQGCA